MRPFPGNGYKPIIGRVFRELKLIEQWGTGMNRMISACKAHGLQPPNFEEIGSTFRVTLFSQPLADHKLPDWHAPLRAHLSEHNEITTKEAARIWNTSDRTARSRLRKLVDQGYLTEVGTGPKDPKKVYEKEEKENIVPGSKESQVIGKLTRREIYDHL